MTTDAIIKRDNSTCQHCGVVTWELYVHHVIPRSQGGSNDASNLIALCKKCHHDMHLHNPSRKKKSVEDKYKTVAVTYRPDQEEKVKKLQSERKLSVVFQRALDDSTR